MIITPENKIREYVAKGWWGTEALGALFMNTAARWPDRLAVADPPNKAAFTDADPLRLSYRLLAQIVDGTAARVLAAGVRKDDIVIVQMPNVVETLVTMLACMRIGAIVSPLAVQYREHELEHILRLLAPRAVVTLTRMGDFRLADLALRMRCRARAPYQVLCWGADVPAQAVTLRPVGPERQAAEGLAGYLDDLHADANDVLSICWTSGTEARPKAVPRTHNQWIAIARVVARNGDIREGDCLMNPFPMINMASIGGAVVPWLLARGTLVLHHPFDLHVFLQQMHVEKVNYNLAPPAVLNMLIRQKELLAGVDLSPLRSLCTGSAPLAPWMLQAWQQDYGINVVNFFGSNEGVALASSAVDVPDPVERARYFPRFGAPGLKWSCDEVITFETRLQDPATGEVIETPGREGELCIRGATVFDGYYGESQLTDAAFDDEGFFRTGDMFSIEGEDEVPRFYRLMGRCKEIIVRGGQNISPAELEGVIEGHPCVAEVACVGIPDELMGERVCAVVVPEPGASMELSELTAYLRDRGVAVFKWPERLVLTAVLPRNALGKVLRLQVRAQALGELDTGRSR